MARSKRENQNSLAACFAGRADMFSTCSPNTGNGAPNETKNPYVWDTKNKAKEIR